MDPLHAVLGGSAVLCLGGLALQARHARAFGPRVDRAPAAGEAAAGVRYAFLAGMAPGAKESVMGHLPTWGLGILAHLGLASAFLALGLRVALPLAGWAPLAPGSLALGSLALGSLAALGGLAALALLAKRLASPELRALSRPDDYLSNLLASGFALLALPAALSPGWGRAWVLWAAVLLLWIPLGKLRHVLFFFPTRRAFGAFFGRRGVLPAPPREA